MSNINKTKTSCINTNTAKTYLYYLKGEIKSSSKTLLALQTQQHEK